MSYLIVECTIHCQSRKELEDCSKNPSFNPHREIEGSGQAQIREERAEKGSVKAIDMTDLLDNSPFILYCRLLSNNY